MSGWVTWSTWGLASYQQGYEPLAKQSTRYVATGASVTACITDLSQYLTNLTAGTDEAHEDTSVRFNHSHPRTIGLQIQVNSTDVGSLWRHGTAGNLEQLRFSAANTILVTVNNATALTYTVAGLDAVRDECVVAWVSEANPDTTGASDAVLSWLYFWNVTNGTFDKVRFTHAVKNLQSTSGRWGANDSLGTNSFAPGVITGIWYENRLQSASEIAVDWVISASEPATVVDTTSEHEGLPATTSTGIHSRDNFHGPAVVWAADKTKRLARRLLSPLYNKRFRSHPTWTDALLTASNPKIRAAPGESDYRMHIGWLQGAPVPDTCSHLWVRVHVFSRASAGAAVPVGVRFYSMNGLPGDSGFEAFSSTEVITRDDEVGVTFGEWDVESLVPISRDAEGNTYLAIALCVDPAAASANDANAQIIVRSCHAVPSFKSSQGGFPVAP